MIQNKLFRDCLATIPIEQKAEFDLSFDIAERISEILKARESPKRISPDCSTSKTQKFPNG